MIKRILLFTLITFILFLVSFYLNQFILDNNLEQLNFSLIKVYAFNAISCAIIYIAVEAIANFLPNETGYLYLGLSMMKLGIFILIFQDALFPEAGLTKAEKSSIVIPFLLFLLLEAIGVSKLLNNK